jgi:hypothetical protein
VAAQISLANIYLRQAGISLQPDDQSSKAYGTPGITVTPLKNAKAVYRIATGKNTPLPVARLLGGEPAAGDLANAIPLINDDPGVIQLIYTDHLKGEKTASGGQIVGDTVAVPPNSYSVAGLALSYRPGAKKSYVAPTMKVLSTPQVGDKAWGLYMLPDAEPTNGTDVINAQTLAHELGHILGLLHRNANNNNDGLYTPGANGEQLPLTTPNNNLMSYTRTEEDLDLIQVIAMQGSSALVNPGG